MCREEVLGESSASTGSGERGQVSAHNTEEARAGALDGLKLLGGHHPAKIASPQAQGFSQCEGFPWQLVEAAPAAPVSLHATHSNSTNSTVEGSQSRSARRILPTAGVVRASLEAIIQPATSTQPAILPPTLPSADPELVTAIEQAAVVQSHSTLHSVGGEEVVENPADTELGTELSVDAANEVGEHTAVGSETILEAWEKQGLQGLSIIVDLSSEESDGFGSKPCGRGCVKPTWTLPSQRRVLANEPPPVRRSSRPTRQPDVLKFDAPHSVPPRARSRKTDVKPGRLAQDLKSLQEALTDEAISLQHSGIIAKGGGVGVGPATLLFIELLQHHRVSIGSATPGMKERWAEAVGKSRSLGA